MADENGRFERTNAVSELVVPYQNRITTMRIEPSEDVG
jgi:hypothetical protein